MATLAFIASPLFACICVAHVHSRITFFLFVFVSSFLLSCKHFNVHTTADTHIQPLKRKHLRLFRQWQSLLSSFILSFFFLERFSSSSLSSLSVTLSTRRCHRRRQQLGPRRRRPHRRTHPRRRRKRLRQRLLLHPPLPLPLPPLQPAHQQVPTRAWLIS